MKTRDPTLHDPFVILHAAIELIAVFMNFFEGS